MPVTRNAFDPKHISAVYCSLMIDEIIIITKFGTIPRTVSETGFSRVGNGHVRF